MKFLIIWFGQLADMFGLHLTSFALLTWTYINTGSVTDFTIIALCGQIPMTLLSPLAGVIVDRYDTRKLMLYSAMSNLAASALLLFLFFFHFANTFYICLVIIFSSALGCIQWPAYQVAITLLVSKPNLGRANAMNSAAWGICLVLAPLTGGIFLKLLSIQTVIAVDVCACCIALLTLLLVRFNSNQAVPADSMPKVYSTYIADLKEGFKYLRKNSNIFLLQAYYAACYFVVSLAGWLLTPIILLNNSEAALGSVMSFGGIGVLLGGFAMTALKVKDEMLLLKYVCICIFVQGTWLTYLGIGQPPIYAMALGNLLFYCAFGIIYAAIPTILQMSADKSVLGRLFGIQRMASIAVLSIASLVAGPIVDNIFNKLLIEGSPLLQHGFTIFGAGIGKGIYLLLFLLGLIAISISLATRGIYRATTIVSKTHEIAVG